MKTAGSAWSVLILVFLAAEPLVARGHGLGPPQETVVLFSREAVLRALFPKSDRVTYRRVRLADDDRRALTARLGARHLEPEYVIFVATTGDVVDGYAVIDQEQGRYEPLLFAVKIAPDGRIQQVELMAHREAHGPELADIRFRRQFVGKTCEDDFEIGADLAIDPKADAPARALAAGVRRAVLLVDRLILSKKD